MADKEQKEMTSFEDLNLTPIRHKLEEAGFEFTDDYFRGSGFLFPDGKYLNLASDTNRSALNEFASRVGCVAHHQLDRYIKDHGLVPQAELEGIIGYNHTLKKPYFICALQDRIVEHTDNAIVVNDGTNYRWENCYIDLNVFARPTEAQFKKLELWIDNIIYSQAPKLDIGFGAAVTSYRIGDEGFTTDEIIKEIKKLYRKD